MGCLYIQGRKSTVKGICHTCSRSDHPAVGGGWRYSCKDMFSRIRGFPYRLPFLGDLIDPVRHSSKCHLPQGSENARVSHIISKTFPHFFRLRIHEFHPVGLVKHFIRNPLPCGPASQRRYHIRKALDLLYIQGCIYIYPCPK